MKKVRHIILLALVPLFAGCDLLDVKPKQEMRREDVYTKEQGYKDVLIGAYMQLASENLYGANTSFYFTDLLAQMWQNVGANTTESYIKQWDFDNSAVEARINTIWRSYYTAIASLNDMLDHIDNYEHVFTNGNYELIKGEALGLRGFLHLELLRLFGPVPSNGAGEQAIPYAEVFSRDPSDFLTLTYEEVIEKILRDLNAAERLLNSDPIVDFSNKELNGSDNFSGKPADPWQLKRQVRFNYFAARAAKARLYNWTGDKAKAVDLALSVIESGKFRLANEGDYTTSSQNPNTDGYQRNLVMLSEHIFGVHNSGHQSVVQPYFKDSHPRLSTDALKISELYDDITSDIRNSPNRYWQEGQQLDGTFVNRYQKYCTTDWFVSTNKIPVIRLCEMYFIVLENIDLQHPEFLNVVAEYGISRAMSGPSLDDIMENGMTFQVTLKEYRKEFYGEGHVFFFLKKHGEKRIDWPDDFEVPSDDYRIPIPKNQSMFEPLNR